MLLFYGTRDRLSVVRRMFSHDLSCSMVISVFRSARLFQGKFGKYFFRSFRLFFLSSGASDLAADIGLYIVVRSWMALMTKSALVLCRLALALRWSSKKLTMSSERNFLIQESVKMILSFIAVSLSFIVEHTSLSIFWAKSCDIKMLNIELVMSPTIEPIITVAMDITNHFMM